MKEIGDTIDVGGTTGRVKSVFIFDSKFYYVVSILDSKTNQKGLKLVDIDGIECCLHLCVNKKMDKEEAREVLSPSKSSGRGYYDKFGNDIYLAGVWTRQELEAIVTLWGEI